MNPLFLELPFGIVVDLSFWQWLFSQNSFDIIKYLFVIGGWVILAYLIFFAGAEFWLNVRQDKHTAKWQWMVLAVDVPPLYVQTPKAVEQIFAHLSGALTGLNIKKKWWLGVKQKWFSLEVISIEGYIQFLIRTEAEFRDLVEAAIYAQYPEAEITEVEDYVDLIPSKFPSSEYNIFGVEFNLQDNDTYPIRTYNEFEYQISKDVTFSDPMAALLENFTRIGKGENIWMQVIISPVDGSWKEKGIELVKKIISNKKEVKDNFTGKIGETPKNLLKEAQRIWYWDFTPEETKDSTSEEGKLSDLTPGVKNTIEAIENKISKIGFQAKLRMVYVANKQVFNPNHGVSGIIGALNQFNVLNRNAIVPYSVTSADYDIKGYFENITKSSFVSAFKKRKLKTGANPYILNIEELSTLWHFPLPSVKAPLVQKTMTKRSEPPTDLPIETTGGHTSLRSIVQKNADDESAKQKIISQPPEDLPYG